MEKRVLTKYEQDWWYWHYNMATKNGMSHKQALKLADESVRSIRKRK